MSFKPETNKSRIANFADVALNNTADNEVLTYSASTKKWQNKASATSSSLPTIAYSAEAVYLGYNLIPNGIPVRSSGTITAFSMRLDAPSDGAQTWELDAFHSDGTVAMLALVTIGASTRSGITTGLAASITKGDLLMVKNTAVAGTYYGLGPSAQIGYGGDSITYATAPGVPTGLSVSMGSGSNTVTWNAVGGAYSYIIWANGKPIAETTSTTYVDTYGASSDTYQVQAAIPGACSALTAAVGASYAYFTQSDGAPSGWTTLLAATGQGQAVSVTSNVMHLVSGSNGNNNANDKVGAMFNDDTGSYQLWDIQGQFCLDAANSTFDIFMASTPMASGFGFSNGVQFEFSPVQGRIGYKSASYTPSGQTQGSFDTVAPFTNYPTAVSANGSSWYGFRCRVYDPGDGTLKAELYQGSVAQQQGGWSGVPPFLTATLDSTMKADLATGRLWILQYGNMTTGAGNQGSRFQSLTITRS